MGRLAGSKGGAIVALRRARNIFAAVFFIVLLHDQKYQKSYKRAFTSLNISLPAYTSRSQEVVRGACCMAAKTKRHMQIREKSSFLLYIGNVTTLLQAGYRYITKAEKALTRGTYMNKMEAYENKHE